MNGSTYHFLSRGYNGDQWRTPTIIQWCQKEFAPLNREKNLPLPGRFFFEHFILSDQMSKNALEIAELQALFSVLVFP